MFVILSESFSGGGAERVLALLANGWGKLDGPIRLISLSSSNSYLNTTKNVEIFNQKIVRGRRLNRLFNIFSAAQSIQRGSVVIVCSYFLLLMLAPFSRVKKIKLIFRPSIDYNYISNEVFDKFGFILGKVILAALNFAIRSSILIYQTPNIKTSFLAVTSLKTVGRVVPNPIAVDSHSFPAYVKPTIDQPLDILLVGRLVSEKGFDRLLISLKDCSRFVRVHLCGEGPQRDDLINIAKDNCIDLKLYGFTNLRESNIRAAILIVPSRVEGFPNVVLEAALAGWPILVSLEVADCIKGSPVAGFCDTAYFESPLDFNYLEKIVQSHSNRKSLESIFSIRQTHSLDNFKKIIREFMF